MSTRWPVSACFLVEVLRQATFPGACHGQGFSWTKPQEREIALREKRVAKRLKLNGEWHHLASIDYEVYTQVDARFTAELSQFMDLFRAQFRSVFKGEVKVRRRPEVFVFSSQEGYQAQVKSSGRGWYRYRFDGQGRFTEHTLYTYVKDGSERKFRQFYHPILMHEGTHQILQELAGRNGIPHWFNEGLATYFQLWDLRLSSAENRKRRPGRLINAGDFLASHESEAMPGLRKLLAIEKWSPDDFGPETRANYSAAESLLLYLMNSDETFKLVNKLYAEVLAGRDPAGIMGETELERLESGWRGFIEKRLLPLARARS